MAKLRWILRLMTLVATLAGCHSSDSAELSDHDLKGEAVAEVGVSEQQLPIVEPLLPIEGGGVPNPAESGVTAVPTQTVGEDSANSSFSANRDSLEEYFIAQCEAEAGYGLTSIFNWCKGAWNAGKSLACGMHMIDGSRDCYYYPPDQTSRTLHDAHVKCCKCKGIRFNKPAWMIPYCNDLR